MANQTFTIYATRIANLKYDTEKDDTYTHAYAQFDIPSEILGQTLVSAELSTYMYGYEYASGAGTSTAVKSNFTAFDGSTSAATMAGFTLSTSLETKNLTSSVGWYNWNVAGDSGKGLTYALANNKTFVNLALNFSNYTPTVKYTDRFYIGLDDNGGQGSVRYFEFAGRTGGTPANQLYLTLVVDMPESNPRVPRSGFVNIF